MTKQAHRLSSSSAPSLQRKNVIKIHFTSVSSTIAILDAAANAAPSLAPDAEVKNSTSFLAPSPDASSWTMSTWTGIHRVGRSRSWTRFHWRTEGKRKIGSVFLGFPYLDLDLSSRGKNPFSDKVARYSFAKRRDVYIYSFLLL